jgi:hypothetical protein
MSLQADLQSDRPNLSLRHCYICLLACLHKYQSEVATLASPTLEISSNAGFFVCGDVTCNILEMKVLVRNVYYGKGRNWFVNTYMNAVCYNLCF